MANWAELLPDLLTAIVKKVELYEDFVSFGGVCRSWRSVAVKKNFCPAVEVPCLLLAEEESGGVGGVEGEGRELSDLRDFYSLTRGGMVHRVYLPEASGKRLFSSLGWLITLDEHGEMELLHPLSRARIPLPSASTFRYYDHDNLLVIAQVKRAVLSASPSVTEDYAVMIVIGSVSHLAYWKPGDTAWSTVETRVGAFENVVYCGCQFYAMDCLGSLFSVDINGPDPTHATLVGRIPTVISGPNNCYLVDFGGDLLVVYRKIQAEEMDGPDGYKELCNYWTAYFKLFKFDSGGNCLAMDDLGGRALFVGQCDSISVVPPAASLIRADCIYFTDDSHDIYVFGEYLIGDDKGGGRDIGIYSLREQSITPLYQGKKGRSFICPPLWVVPSF